jgi:hypothetical protein
MENKINNNDNNMEDVISRDEINKRRKAIKQNTNLIYQSLNEYLSSVADKDMKNALEK